MTLGEPIPGKAPAPALEAQRRLVRAKRPASLATTPGGESSAVAPTPAAAPVEIAGAKPDLDALKAKLNALEDNPQNLLERAKLRKDIADLESAQVPAGEAPAPVTPIEGAFVEITGKIGEIPAGATVEQLMEKLKAEGWNDDEKTRAYVGGAIAEAKRRAALPKEPVERGEAPAEGGIEAAPITSVEGIESDRSTLPAERADALSKKFSSNRDIAVRIIQTEILDAGDLKHVAEAGKATVDELRKEYGRRRLGFQESSAVEAARKARDTADREKSSEERVRNKVYREHKFDDEEVKGFQTLVQIELKLRESRLITAADISKLSLDEQEELFSVLDTMTKAVGIDTASSLKEIMANWEHATQPPQIRNRYRTVKAFETGGAEVTSGRTKLKPKGRLNLEKRSEAAQKEYDGALSLEGKVWQSLKERPETDGRIRDLATYLQSLRAMESTIDSGYLPDRASLERVISDLDNAHAVSEKLHQVVSVNTVDLTAEGRGIVTYKVDGRLLKDANSADKAIRTSRETLSDLIDPAKKLAAWREFTSILPLAQRENPDISRLSPQDRAKLAVAQALLGITPTSVDLGTARVVRPAAAAAAPTPPAEPVVPPTPTPEPKPAAPTADKKPFAQMTGAELAALGYEGIVAVVPELSQEQLASLPEDIRNKLILGDALTPDKLANLEKNPVAEQLADGLLDPTDSNPVATLNYSVAERDAGKDGLDRNHLPGLKAECDRRVAESVDAPKDKPINRGEAEKKAKEMADSKDSSIAAKGKKALKLLGLGAAIIALSSTAGGEQH